MRPLIRLQQSVAYIRYELALSATATMANICAISFVIRFRLLRLAINKVSFRSIFPVCVSLALFHCHNSALAIAVNVVSHKKAARCEQRQKQNTRRNGKKNTHTNTKRNRRTGLTHYGEYPRRFRPPSMTNWPRLPPKPLMIACNSS